MNQYYGSSHTLRGISLSVKQRRVPGAAGRNGVGKTTLLKCLMGVLPVARGKVTLDGRDITRLKPHQRAAAGIAYVPQGREIFARLTVEENLLMGMATLPAREAGNISGEVLSCSRCLRRCCSGAAATCPAASSSSWPSRAPCWRVRS
jgi:urea transport system ATP-binding protein